MNQERIFRIGTAAACEIVVPDGIPSNVVWVHLTISEEGMHLLTIVEHGIVCCVNGNAVSQQYWGHSAILCPQSHGETTGGKRTPFCQPVTLSTPILLWIGPSIKQFKMESK